MSERLDVHLHLHVAPETLGFFRHFQKDIRDMRASLLAAQASALALVTSVTDLKTAYAAYVADEPKRTAAAVAEALANEGADEDTIAAATQTALDNASAGVSDALAAIHSGTSEPTPPDVSTLPATPDATDTPAGGQADDSVTGGQGSDSVGGPTGDDSVTGSDGSASVSGAAGDDSVNGGQGSDSVNTSGATASDNADPSSVPADPTSPDVSQAADPSAPGVSGATDPNA